MSTTLTPAPAPDYGEPWGLSSFRNCIVTRGGQTEDIRDALRNRSLKCVNACAGMADPAAEIARLKSTCEWHEREAIRRQAAQEDAERENAAMREAIKEAYEALANVSPIFGRTPAQDAALAKLQPFITP